MEMRGSEDLFEAHLQSRWARKDFRWISFIATSISRKPNWNPYNKQITIDEPRELSRSPNVQLSTVMSIPFQRGSTNEGAGHFIGALEKESLKIRTSSLGCT
jgi:hypothetical protein